MQVRPHIYAPFVASAAAGTDAVLTCGQLSALHHVNLFLACLIAVAAALGCGMLNALFTSSSASPH